MHDGTRKYILNAPMTRNYTTISVRTLKRKILVIGSIGLYGFISFTSTEREKEIGIRKVLGASVRQIAMIFSREFFVLIVVSFLIATPLATFPMQNMLQNFAYRIPIEWTMFAMTIGLTLLVAFVTVGYKSLKTSLTNPIDSLRAE